MSETGLKGHTIKGRKIEPHHYIDSRFVFALLAYPLHKAVDNFGD